MKDLLWSYHTSLILFSFFYPQYSHSLFYFPFVIPLLHIFNKCRIKHYSIYIFILSYSNLKLFIDFINSSNYYYFISSRSFFISSILFKAPSSSVYFLSSICCDYFFFLFFLLFFFFVLVPAQSNINFIFFNSC